MQVTFTSREFNRDPAGVKRAAADGPVFITDRDRPALVVMAIDHYRALAGQGRSLLDVLAIGEDQDFEFEPPKAQISARAATLD
jgi:prevent-host-death family protein